jgi:hypothetical protein
VISDGGSWPSFRDLGVLPPESPSLGGNHIPEPKLFGQQKVLAIRLDRHVQLSLKSFEVNASRRLTTFGCFICLHFSIAENDSWLDTLYPVS